MHLVALTAVLAASASVALSAAIPRSSSSSSNNNNNNNTKLDERQLGSLLETTGRVITNAEDFTADELYNMATNVDDFLGVVANDDGYTGPDRDIFGDTANGVNTVVDGLLSPIQDLVDPDYTPGKKNKRQLGSLLETTGRVITNAEDFTADELYNMATNVDDFLGVVANDDGYTGPDRDIFGDTANGVNTVVDGLLSPIQDLVDPDYTPGKKNKRQLGSRWYM